MLPLLLVRVCERVCQSDVRVFESVMCLDNFEESTSYSFVTIIVIIIIIMYSSVLV